MISAIGGTAGVGKTALALHWAHQVAGRFPDGQLHVNLRGFDPSGTPATPAEATRGFLDALGVPPARIPPAPRGSGRPVPQPAGRQADADRAGQRPRRAAGTAAAAGQPGQPGLVTSRNQLTGLAAADGARLVSLDVLSHAEAVQLLTGPAGPGPGRRRTRRGQRDRPPVRLPAAGAGRRRCPRRRPARASRWPPWPASCATPRPAGRPGRRRPGSQRPGGVLLVLPASSAPRPRGCSGCWASTPAPTSPSPPPPASPQQPRPTPAACCAN